MNAFSPGLPLVDAIAEKILYLDSIVSQGLQFPRKLLTALQHTSAEEQKFMLSVELPRLFRSGKPFGTHFGKSVANCTAENSDIIKTVWVVEGSPLSLVGPHGKSGNSPVGLVLNLSLIHI